MIFDRVKVMNVVEKHKRIFEKTIRMLLKNTIEYRKKDSKCC
ncbi:MAG: hypothetical protein K0R18_2223 [Bacillales bacterium]|jgi:hypothetical protein|nr:hypothetical protein [Bacillales bacterium]